MRRLLALVLVIPACVADPWSDEGNGGGDGGGGGSTIVCSTSDPSISFDGYIRCDGGLCPYAAGGRGHVSFGPASWRSTTVTVDGVFSQDPAVYDDFFLRSNAPGTGRLQVRGVRCLGRSEEVVHDIPLVALPVEQVRLRTADEIYTYNPASPYVVYSTDRIGYRVPGHGTIELVGGGRHLVDSSVHLAPGTSPAIYQSGNHIEVEEPGVHDVIVAADSFGGRTHSFQVHAFERVDRVEARLTKVPLRGGDFGTACFYAFAQDYEIAWHTYTIRGNSNVEWKFSVQHQPNDNCLTFKATSAGTGRVTAVVDGIEQSIEFPIGPWH